MKEGVGIGRMDGPGPWLGQTDMGVIRGLFPTNCQWASSRKEKYHWMNTNHLAKITLWYDAWLGQTDG